MPSNRLNKGEAIRVVGGKYAGRKGWKHKEKGETDSQIYLILQEVKNDDGVIQPEKVVRIDKMNYMPFTSAVAPIQVVLEQKPKLQKKVTDLIKELVKLEVKPHEDFLILLGHQWVTAWETKRNQVSVDFTRPDSPPTVPDENDADEID